MYMSNDQKAFQQVGGEERFTHRLFRVVQPIWDASLNHPFLTGLKDGTLDQRKFAYYMRQDYVYLIDYAKVFAIGSIKAPDLETMGKFARLLDATLNMEMELHRQYAAKFGISHAELEATRPSPTTIAYTKYLLDAAQTGSFPELVAVLLPCMWGYNMVGKEFAKDPKALEHPLYKDWVLMYSSAEFSELTDWTLGLLDRLADGLPERELAKLEEHFLVSSRFEYMFWDAAYREEGWPV